MLKKFLIGTLAVVAFAVVANVALAADFGPDTLRQGSTGMYVSNLQTALGLTADGNFGPMTKAKVMAFQSSKGLTADGVVGAMTKAALNAGAVVTPPPTGGDTGGGTTNLPAGCTSTAGYSMTTGAKCDGTTGGGAVDNGPLQGGAGDINITTTSTDVEGTIKEGDTEKVLGVKIEADGSDVSLTSVRVELEHATGTGSTKPSRYMDVVKVMLADKEVGSIEVSDLSKDGSIYRGSVSLTNAVVREDDKETLHLAVETLDSVDNTADEFDVRLLQVRYQDAEGVVSTETGSPLPHEETFGFDGMGADDDMSIKSSNSNPDSITLKVDDNNDSDEYLVLQYKLDVDEDSGDITVNEIPVVLTFASGGNDADDADQIVKEVRVEVGDESYDADLDASTVTNGVGAGTYSVDTDGDLVIESGDVVDVKVYVTFNDQDPNGITAGNNYNSGTTVTASSVGADFDAEGEDNIIVSGTGSGKTHTLNVSGVTFSSYSWAKTEGTGVAIIDFLVTVEAEDEAFTLLNTSVIGSAVIDGAASAPLDCTAGNCVLSKISGDATASVDDFIINEGDTARFRVRVTGATDVEVTMTSFGGQQVPDDKELSPTAVAQ